MKKIRVALIEIAGSHDECMLTQINALKSADAEIHLICDKDVFARNTETFASIPHQLEINTTGAAIGDFRLMKSIVRYLKSNGIQKVVFNTAQGGHVRNLALLMPKSIECYGIIHTIRKFNESFTQKIIHRMIKNYVVLSDDLLKRIKPDPRLSVRSFYPVDFPKAEYKAEKSEGETWIAIPGGVETRRKDLESLPEMIAATPENVTFIFLGKTDYKREDVKAFLDRLDELSIKDRVVLYDDFVPTPDFFAVLSNTDFLLPLIHPNTPSAEQYIVNQISGSFTLSFGLKIPLLIHRHYQTEEDLKVTSFFYNIETFGNDFETSKEKLTEKIVQIDAVEKWNSTFQHENYLKFIKLF